MSELAETAEPPGADQVEENLRSMIPARMRSDLIIKKQRFKNEDYYVIKDPLALTYQRLGPEEAYLVSLLDGKRNMASIIEEFKQSFPNWEMTLREAAAFVNQLGNSGLLNINARKFVDFARKSKRPANNLLALWAKVFSKLIFLKIPLVDPSPWLGKLTAKFSWVWTRPFIIGCLCFFAWTLIWLFTNRQEFASNNITFFSPQNLALIWIQMILIKTCHEFGHAMTSRHFGAEVHEMGVCMICFTPCGYVDATDAYMMKYKRHKIYTVIAGIFIEFIIASIAAYIWLYSGPGLIKNLAFNAMIVASINTVFFNMNPLMKFDGYYVISDLLEIPNLRTKSISYCSYSFQKYVLGIRNLMLEPIFEEDSNSKVFFLYAIAAFSYMGFIIISLSQIFATVLTPYGLGQFGLAIGMFAQFSFIGYPIIKVIYDAFGASSKHHIERVEPVRKTLIKRILPIAIVIAIILAIPSRYEIKRQGFAIYDKAEIVSTNTGGILHEVVVKTGDWIEADTVIGVLQNPRIEADLNNSYIALQNARLQYGAMQSSKAYDNVAKLSQAAAQLESAESNYRLKESKFNALIIKSPISGYITTQDLHLKVGDYINPGDVIAQIAEKEEMRLIVALTEKEVELIEQDSKVTGRWVTDGSKFESNLDVFPDRAAKLNEYHPSMLTMFGGPAPVEQNENRRAGQPPSFSLFLAEAPLAQLPIGMRAQEGMRIRATIQGKPTTIGSKVWREIVSFWDNRLRSFTSTPTA